MKHLRKYNESFSNEFELSEALKIYEEELPFSMDNIKISHKTREPLGGKCDVYRVEYDHIDEELKNKLSEVYDMDYDVAGYDFHSIVNSIKEKVDAIFSKFAKKYDMTYKRNEHSGVMVTAPGEGNDVIIVRFDLITPYGDTLRASAHRSKKEEMNLRKYNESKFRLNIDYPKSEELAKSIRIELEDCKEFNADDITVNDWYPNETSSLIRLSQAPPNFQIYLMEDFSDNEEIRAMIDKRLAMIDYARNHPH